MEVFDFPTKNGKYSKMDKKKGTNVFYRLCKKIIKVKYYVNPSNLKYHKLFIS